MKYRGYIIISILFLLIGIVIGYVIRRNFSEGNSGLLLWNYYFFSIVGGFGTFSTVVVALFKDFIKDCIWHPKFQFSFVNDGIYEKLKTGVIPLAAEEYQCRLRITNNGNKSANNCQLFIDQIEFAETGSSTFESISDISPRELKWESSLVTIPQDRSKDILLFSITKKTTVPNADQTDPGEYQIILNGPTNIQPRFLGGGQLKLNYMIVYNDGKTLYQSITVKGSGVWQDRKSEISKKITIELK